MYYHKIGNYPVLSQKRKKNLVHGTSQNYILCLVVMSLYSLIWNSLHSVFVFCVLHILKSMLVTLIEGGTYFNNVVKLKILKEALDENNLYFPCFFFGITC